MALVFHGRLHARKFRQRTPMPPGVLTTALLSNESFPIGYWLERRAYVTASPFYLYFDAKDKKILILTIALLVRMLETPKI